MREPVDRLGLVRPGVPLLVYLPAYDAYVPLLPKNRRNLGYETYEYGPLPDCGAISGGVIAAGGVATGCTFSNPDLQGEQAKDMFYYTDPDTLVQAHFYIRPMMLRILNEVPLGNKTYSLYGIVTQDLRRDFGWFRFHRELVFLPKMHVGWEFYNQTNLALRTHARIVYGEYDVEPLLDVEALTRVLAGRAPAHVVSFGGPIRTREIEIGVETWGAVMVPRPPSWYREDEIRRLVSEALKR